MRRDMSYIARQIDSCRTSISVVPEKWRPELVLLFIEDSINENCIQVHITHQPLFYHTQSQIPHLHRSRVLLSFLSIWIVVQHRLLPSNTKCSLVHQQDKKREKEMTMFFPSSKRKWKRRRTRMANQPFKWHAVHTLCDVRKTWVWCAFVCLYLVSVHLTSWCHPSLSSFGWAYKRARHERIYVENNLTSTTCTNKDRIKKRAALVVLNTGPRTRNISLCHYARLMTSISTQDANAIGET